MVASLALVVRMQYTDVWSVIEVKIVFKMSALCGEYINQRIYKYVDVYNKYVGLFVNTSTYLYILQRTYKSLPTQTTWMITLTIPEVQESKVLTLRVG